MRKFAIFKKDFLTAVPRQEGKAKDFGTFNSDRTANAQ